MDVVVERGRTLAFEELPPASLALDGYVQGPAVDVEGRRFSFDHHDRCLRLVTRATCQQVLDALLLGFDPAGTTAYVNDVDGDTALSVWLLENPAQATRPEVRRLIESVGAIDAHGPAYPALDPQLADAFFAGPMAPEAAARRDGSYHGLDLAALLRACVDGIQAWVEAGLPAQPAPEPVHYEVLRRGTGGWALVTIEGAAFREMYAAGLTRLVTQRELPDGTWQYTVAKRSDLVAGFPVGPPSRPGTILGALAAREPGWGGGSSIGGSPRNADGSSSKLTPDEVFEIVEAVLAGT